MLAQGREVWAYLHRPDFLQGASLAVASKLAGGSVRQVQWYLQLRNALELPPHAIEAASDVLNDSRCFRLLLLDNALELLSFLPAWMLHGALQDVFPLGWRESSSKVVNTTSVLASGVFAGGVTLLILHPLKAFRTRCFVSAFDPSMSLLPREDVLQLYQGLSMSFFSMVVYRGAYVGVFSVVRRLLHEDTQPFTAHVLAAGLAGVASYPLELIANHQMATGKHLTETISHIVSKGGRQGLYAGLNVYLALTPVKGMCAAGTIVGGELVANSWQVFNSQ